MSEAVAAPLTDDYRVKLEVFSGPLDLLLHLIRVEEVDIYDIPIAKITSQYLRYVDLMKNLDLEVAGEFILMAASLIRIKTRLLLPQDDVDSEEPDPREELILALVEYKKFKEASEIFADRARIEEHNFVPPPPVEEYETRVDLQPMTSLYDLIVAYKEAVTVRKVVDVHEVKSQRVTIEDRMEAVLEMLRDRESASFTELFSDMPRKIVAVVTLVALLELARVHRVRLFQAVPFSEVRVYPGEKFSAPFSELALIDSSSDIQGMVS